MIERKYRYVGVASVSAICLASAFAMSVARAQTIEPGQDFRLSDTIPSQDYAGAETYRTNENTRVAQFFPFFFSEPRAQPQYQYQQRQPKVETDPRGTIRRRPVDEQGEAQRPRSPKMARRSSGEPQKEHILSLLRNPPTVAQPKGPLLLTVSIAKQKVTVYDAGVQIAEAPISSGTVDRPTPMGVFSVVEKSWWHRSNMYSAAPMPFMQRITWSGVALHAGELPGYRASHGCVRLPESFALQLWYMTRVGARVIIGWNEMAPVAIEHPLLFQPSTIPLPPDRPEPPAVTPPPEAVISMNEPEDASQDVPADNADSDTAAAVASQQEAPYEESAIAEDDPELDHMMMASTDDGAGMYDELATQVELRLPLLAAGLEPAATALLRAKPPTGIFALAARRKVTRHASAAMPDPELDAVLRPGPVSVLVSRKERRIYVRKGLQPVFAMPISVREPDRAIGTHVFTAVTASADGSKLNWTVVSPTSEPLNRAASLQPTAAAIAALDRIDIPQETIDRITPLVSTGATLIITDMGLGRTANLLDSDYTVLLRHEISASRTPSAPRYAPQHAPPRQPADSFIWFR